MAATTKRGGEERTNAPKMPTATRLPRPPGAPKGSPRRVPPQPKPETQDDKDLAELVAEEPDEAQLRILKRFLSDFNMAQRPEGEDLSEIPFATKADFGGTAEFEDRVLPMAGRKVRIRYLDTPEVAGLQYLPDVIGYQSFMETLIGKEDEPTPKEMAKAAEKNHVYMAAVAHRAILDHERMGETEECEECEGDEHPVALFSVVQTRRFSSQDLGFCMEIALRAQSLGFLRPFSPGPTDSTTDSSASTGESTPEQTSSE
jgi:hypothetical protein